MHLESEPLIPSGLARMGAPLYSFLIHLCPYLKFRFKGYDPYKAYGQILYDCRKAPLNTKCEDFALIFASCASRHKGKKNIPVL